MIRDALDDVAQVRFWIDTVELRRAEWAEFNLDAAEWRIPAERMKMRVHHIVPLSTQAVAILREIQPLAGVWEV